MAAADTCTDKKLKILCLHGYRQNAQSFRERTGAFRKIPIVKKSIELVFISAPNRVPPQTTDNGAGADSNDGQQGWWFSKEDDTYNALNFTGCCKGYEESLEAIKKTIQDEGPFDGILSFSQGAALASLLCGLREQDPDGIYRFNFVILVAGFRSRQSQHDHLYKVPFSVPSLHVYGDTDKVIPKDMSEDLLQYFVDPSTLQHEGGHFIPTGAPQKKIYTAFFQQMLDSKYS